MQNINAAEVGRGAEWLLEGFGYFKRSAGAWIGVTVLLFIISFVASLIPIIRNLAILLLTPVFTGGLILGCRAQDEGGALGINHLFAGFGDKLGQLIVVGLLYFAGVLVVAFLTGIVSFLLIGDMGFLHELAAGEVSALTEHSRSILLISLIFMAIYMPLIMAMWFAPALVVLRDRSAVDAMISSFMGCLKNIVPFLFYGLVGLALSIVATVPFMLGWLILIPMIVASMYIALKDIFPPEAVETSTT